MDDRFQGDNPFAYRQFRGKRDTQRQGVGRVRYLSCRILWLQQLISDGVIRLGVVAGSTNPADIGTKRLPNGRLRSLMFLPGMYNVSSGALEGADDPGNVFRKKKHLMCQMPSWASRT